MLSIACVSGMTSFTAMGAHFYVTVGSEILVVLIRKTNFLETYILCVTNLSTKRTTCRDITISAGIVNIGNQNIISHLAFLLNNKRENLGYRWYRFHKENM